MRGRRGLLLGAAAFAAVTLLAAVLGQRNRGVTDEDARASTYLNGPGGVSGLWEALPALGVTVTRLRERPRQLPSDSGRGRSALLVLAPTSQITSLEQRALLAYNERQSGGGDLVVAGLSAWTLMRCFGYTPQPMVFDSVRAFAPGGAPMAGAIWSRVTLARSTVRNDSASMFRGVLEPCAVPALRHVDTLLTSSRGPVVLRLERAGAGSDVILVADASIFRNRRVRDSGAGPFVTGLLARRYERVTFDEYHHGYGASGSLARAIIGWSARSPLGWMVWQAAVIGVLALLAAAVRFGPPRTVLQRRRRAPMEHVRALATALAAVRGHDVAIGVLVQGLRRRLAPGRAVRGAAEDSQRWLERLERRGVPPAARPALTSLRNLMKPGQDEAAVLRAANDVEDVWDTLRHSAPTSWRH
jgi:uncharacterized protein DUF4350